MKAKSIAKKNRLPYKFFLLLIAPVLIGLVLFLSPQVHSEWEKEDEVLLLKSPKNQGWAQVEYIEEKEPTTSETNTPAVIAEIKVR